MKKLFFQKIVISILLSTSLGLYGQGIKYMGLVLDEDTKEALAFVNVISVDGQYGTTTDIEGKFSLVLPGSIESVRFSCLGYKTQVVSTSNLKGPKTIYLKQYKEEPPEGNSVNNFNARDKEIYRLIDSLEKADYLDKRLKRMEMLLTGNIGIGYIDILLNRLIGFNSYEGFWSGLGVQTNNRFSERFELGAFYAYSLKDKRSKFGGKTSVLLYKPKEIKVHLHYLSNNIETGNVEFYNDEKALFDPLAFQKFLINKMDYTIREEVGFSTRLLKYIQVYGGFRHESVENSSDYEFIQPDDNQLFDKFQTAELHIRFRFAFKERHFDIGQMKTSMGINYTVFWFNYSQGVTQILGGDYHFRKVDFQMRKSVYSKYLGVTNMAIKVGRVIGDVPYAKLYSAGGTYSSLTIFAPGSFGTMRPNEFLSDSYFSLFFSHNFGTLVFKGAVFKPEFEIISNIGFGWLKHPEYHQNIPFKTMEKGYFESGLMINNLIRLPLFNVGIGGLYRYGSYSLGNFKENVAYKFTVTWPMNSKLAKPLK